MAHQDRGPGGGKKALLNMVETAMGVDIDGDGRIGGRPAPGGGHGAVQQHGGQPGKPGQNYSAAAGEVAFGAAVTAAAAAAFGVFNNKPGNAPPPQNFGGAPAPGAPGGFPPQGGAPPPGAGPAVAGYTPQQQQPYFPGQQNYQQPQYGGGAPPQQGGGGAPFCGACGAPFNPAMRFCGACGRPR